MSTPASAATDDSALATLRRATGHHTVLAACALVAVLAPWLAAWLAPPFAQPQAYHDFADQRTLMGVPHALNVLSNLAFVAAGLVGLAAFARLHFTGPGTALRAPWWVLFAGVTLTGIGSAWYHLDPNDATLVWDRLPMAFAFSGLIAGTLAERAPRIAWPLLVVFVLVGTGSVVYWRATGNLLPYLVMQAAFIAIAVAATALMRAPATHASWLYGAAALYAAAMISEKLDHPIGALTGGFVSGHTLKHLLAAAAAYVVYRMLRGRSVVDRPAP